MTGKKLKDGSIHLEMNAKEWSLFRAFLGYYDPQPSSANSDVSCPIVGIEADTSIGTDPILEDATQWLSDMKEDHEKALHKRLARWLVKWDERKDEAQDVGTIEMPPEEVEGLLQILNYLRMKHWRLLGSPDMNSKKSDDWSEEQLPSVHVMGLCALFQSILLQILYPPNS